MEDNRHWFIHSSNYQTLYNDIAHGERVVHHALDNWGMNMSDGLQEALQALEKASIEVKRKMQEDKEV